jgi:hypothetical protein
MHDLKDEKLLQFVRAIFFSKVWYQDFIWSFLSDVKMQLKLFERAFFAILFSFVFKKIHRLFRLRNNGSTEIVLLHYANVSDQCILCNM